MYYLTGISHLHEHDWFSTSVTPERSLVSWHTAVAFLSPTSQWLRDSTSPWVRIWTCGYKHQYFTMEQTWWGSNSKGLTRMSLALGYASPLKVIFFFQAKNHVMSFRSPLSHEKKLLRLLTQQRTFYVLLLLETLNMNPDIHTMPSTSPIRLVLQPSFLVVLGK